jgi:hypothetical protein
MLPIDFEYETGLRKHPQSVANGTIVVRSFKPDSGADDVAVMADNDRRRLAVAIRPEIPLGCIPGDPR